MKLETIEEITFEMLKEHPSTRDDDFKLYGAVLNTMNFDLNMSLREFLLNAKKMDAPSLEGVPRTRRKLFKIYPEFQKLSTKLAREEKEREYIKYSRGE